ncbi:hypothetical protein OUZ56_029664 [Daphnia magna]|uniref:Uncharacterized protein n=1 Tax=Daphnia magna TaxID=35525 RepID=A0ABR0B7G9_9CRUS|nr:hypothetical protein OUZ56_029664 [Daphnia magna]
MVRKREVFGYFWHLLYVPKKTTPATTTHATTTPAVNAVSFCYIVYMYPTVAIQWRKLERVGIDQRDINTAHNIN